MEKDRVYLNNLKKEEQTMFLQTLREVCARYGRSCEVTSISQALLFLRRDIRQGLSDFNGELSLSIFTKTELFPILEKVVSFLPQPNTTQDLFGVTRRFATSQGVPDSGFSFAYIYSHLRLSFSAFLSTWIGRKLFGKVFVFDPKGFAKNISGFLFREEIGGRILDWTVGPTPTLGEHLAPEAQRTIEFLPHSEYSKWIYVNLQSLSSRSERGRSLALLRASTAFRDRFCVASISVDSPLYRGKETLSSLSEEKKILFGQLSRAIFENDTTEYFFSVSGKRRELWWNIVEEVVEKAFCCTEQVKKNKSRVFHELVVLGLIRAWQSFNMPKEGEKAFSTIACKECIDRGGSVNAAFYWAFQGDEIDEKTRGQKVMSVLWGRPLLARGRLIEKSRTHGFESLVKELSPSVVRAYLESIWKLC